MKVLKMVWGQDFPGGPVVKNLPWNAGDQVQFPGKGTKISHAMEQLSLNTVITKPTISGALWTATRELAHHNNRSCMMQEDLTCCN